jgi:hypothetical protein
MNFERKEISEVIKGITFIDDAFLDRKELRVDDIFKIKGE